MRRMIKAVKDNQNGNFAVIVALMAVPLIGFTGFAVDYSRALNARSFMQDRSDAMALAVASVGPETDSAKIFESLRAKAKADSTFGAVDFTGRWTSLSDYTVESTSNVALTLGSIIPGAGTAMPVATKSVARYIGAKYTYKPPTVTQLDPEAGDYNRVAAYCFDPSLKSSASKGRSQIVEIADNGKSTFNEPMPQCDAGQMLSFRLYNSRSARTTPARWLSPTNENYSYYTDTTLGTDGAEKYDLDGWPILETVMCPSLEKCVGKSAGGVLPEGKNRTPQRTSEKCGAGKYMYYGWEDRPPGRGSSDRDYDDIRVIIECPTVQKTGDENVRLVQ